MSEGRDPTASDTDAFLQCQFAFREDVPLFADPTNRGREQGDRLHALAETFARTGEDLATEQDVPIIVQWRKLQRWLEWWRQYTDGVPRFVEKAFAYNTETDEGVELAVKAHRAYGVSLPWIPGTADLCAVWPDFVEIWDIKSGKRKEHANRSGQLRSLGLAASRFFDKPRAIVHLVRVRPRLNIEPNRDELEPWDIDIHAERLQRAARALPMAEPVTGPACFFCKAATCPVKRREVA